MWSAQRRTVENRGPSACNAWLSSRNTASHPYTAGFVPNVRLFNRAWEASSNTPELHTNAYDCIGEVRRFQAANCSPGGERGSNIEPWG